MKTKTAKHSNTLQRTLLTTDVYKRESHTSRLPLTQYRQKITRNKTILIFKIKHI